MHFELPTLFCLKVMYVPQSSQKYFVVAFFIACAMVSDRLTSAVRSILSFRNWSSVMFLSSTVSLFPILLVSKGEYFSPFGSGPSVINGY